MISTHYERIGGAEKVRALVQRFYQLMDELPEAHGIRKLHPASLQGSEQKLYEFLSGWMGGPQLFIEKYGHPVLRKRHLPFPIAESERDQWRVELVAAFEKVADHMRNQS